MCRAKDESGRRCPCDTSAARQARRVNARSRGSVTATQSPADVHAHDPQPVAQEESLDSLRETADQARETYYATISEGRNSEISPLDASNAFAEASYAMGQRMSSLVEERAGLTYEQVEEAMSRQNDLSDALTAVYESPDYRTFGSEHQEAREAAVEQAEKIRHELDEGREKLHEMRKKLSEASYEVLSEACGEELGPGEEGILISEHTSAANKSAQEDLERAAYIYPRSWIEESNTNKALLPLLPVYRSGVNTYSYHERTMHKFSSTQKLKTPVIHEFSTGAPPKDEEHNYRPLTQEEKDAIIAENPGRAYMLRGEHIYAKQEWVTHSNWEHPAINPETGLPAQRGWQKKEVWVRNWNQYDENADDAYVKEERVMKPKRLETVKSRQTQSVLVSKISIPRSKEGANPTIMHEFGHRCEDAVPLIGKMESKFLQRRAGDDDIVHLDGYDCEGYTDSFANAYSGRTYGRGKFHEIMTTGVEATFIPHHGVAYYGHDALFNQKEGTFDRDYHAFILGTLATVKPRKTSPQA